jgi:hypothetical protein
LVGLRRRPLLRNALIVLALFAALTGVLFATGVAGSALAAVGIGGGGHPDPSRLTTPEQDVNGVPTFPTPTIPGWKVQPTPPSAALPSSQTPAPGTFPSPTPTDGAAPQPSPTGSPPTGVPTTCHGGASGASWSFSTCPPIHGQRLTLTITARAYPSSATNIVLSFGTCSGCTLLLTPQQGYKLDASGGEAVTVTIPVSAANSSVPVSGMIQFAGGPSLSISAAPVQ